MQGDMASQRSCARNPTCILIYAYPFPARAASRPSFRCCCGLHGNGGSARPSGGVGGSCHGISCFAASLIRCRTTTSLGRARDRRCSVGARAGRQWTIDDMCVLHVCILTCQKVVEGWKDADAAAAAAATAVAHTRLSSCRGLRSTVGTTTCRRVTGTEPIGRWDIDCSAYYLLRRTMDDR